MFDSDAAEGSRMITSQNYPAFEVSPVSTLRTDAVAPEPLCGL